MYQYIVNILYLFCNYRLLDEFSGSEAFCNFFSVISDIFKCVNNPELFVFWLLYSMFIV